MKHRIAFGPAVIAQALAEWLEAHEQPFPQKLEDAKLIINENRLILSWEEPDAKT